MLTFYFIRSHYLLLLHPLPLFAAGLRVRVDAHELLFHLGELVDARCEVLDLALVHAEGLSRLLHSLRELLVLLLVVSQHLHQLFLFVLLQSCLLDVHCDLLLYLIILLRYLFGHLSLDGPTSALLLHDLLIHHLGLLLDLLHQCLVLCAQHVVLLGDLPAALRVELLRILAYLLLNHRQVILEVRDNVLALLLLSLDDALMVVLQVLVLVLVLTG